MGGGELILKQGKTFWLLKLGHDGQSLEEFLIKQKQAFSGKPEDVLKKFFTYFDSTYYNPELELNSFYPRGFKTEIDSIPVDRSDSIGEVMYHLECVLHKKIFDKNLDPEQEDFLEVLGENCSLLIDYDQGKIFGYLDEEGDFSIVDRDYKMTKEQI